MPCAICAAMRLPSTWWIIESELRVPIPSDLSATSDHPIVTVEVWVKVMVKATVDTQVEMNTGGLYIQLDVEWKMETGLQFLKVKGEGFE
jgi:hypothetical protein